MMALLHGPLKQTRSSKGSKHSHVQAHGYSVSATIYTSTLHYSNNNNTTTTTATANRYCQPLLPAATMPDADVNNKAEIDMKTSSDLSAASMDPSSAFPPDATPISKPQSSVEKGTHQHSSMSHRCN